MPKFTPTLIIVDTAETYAPDTIVRGVRGTAGHHDPLTLGDIAERLTAGLAVYPEAFAYLNDETRSDAYGELAVMLHRGGFTHVAHTLATQALILQAPDLDPAIGCLPPGASIAGAGGATVAYHTVRAIRECLTGVVVVCDHGASIVPIRVYPFEPVRSTFVHLLANRCAVQRAYYESTLTDAGGRQRIDLFGSVTFLSLADVDLETLSEDTTICYADQSKKMCEMRLGDIDNGAIPRHNHVRVPLRSGGHVDWLLEPHVVPVVVQALWLWRSVLASERDLATMSCGHE